LINYQTGSFTNPMPDLETARKWYPENDPVHGYEHVVRVYRMAEYLARQEGANPEIVRAAALLHDAQPNHLSESRRHDHQQSAADIASQLLKDEGWTSEAIKSVQHCIRAHRFRDDSENPATLEAQILFDADKLDAIGAIGVARAIGFAIQAGQPEYAPPSQLFLQTGQLESGEMHSAYHEYIYKLRKLKERLYTPTARRIAADRHHLMVEFFEHLAQEWSGER
jgi:uncharacterized protein